MPIMNKMSMDGSTDIKFSGKVRVPSPVELLYYLKMEDEKVLDEAETTRRRLDDETTVDLHINTDESDVSVSNELEQLESILKLSGCIKIDLIPG